MITLAERIIRIAEAEVGVAEDPPGSNRGKRVQEYQASTSLPGTGWPWCAAWISFVWQAAGVPREVARRIASPSTAVMCTVARSDALVCSPRPGAAIVWCGRHVELLHSRLGGGVWRCIGGNSGDAVRWTTRSTAGALIFGPPGLEDAGPALEAEDLYWLEDSRAEYRVAGPWRRKAVAETELRQLRAPVRRRARIVRPGSGGYALRIGEPRQYGPWLGDAGKAARDRARERLEERLGRRLRPYRTRRMPKARPETLGKTT
jgi:hypothetical protein